MKHMSYELSISGVSAPECECNPYSRAETSAGELMGVIRNQEDALDFIADAVSKIVVVYKCEGPLKGDCIKTCGQLLTAHLFDQNETGLLSADFMSQVVLE